jgi:hypothetical protein
MVVIGVIISGIALQLSQKPSSSTSPYVEVDYRTVGWFYDSIVSYTQNCTYFLFNVTITNKGYSKAILTEPWDFSILINDVTYSAWGLGSVPTSLYNGTTTTEEIGTPPLNYSYTTVEDFAPKFSAVPSVSIANGSQISGIIAFQLTTKPQTFTLGYSPDFSDYSLPKPQIRIVEEP